MTISGTYSVSGGISNTNSTNGSFELYVDPKGDTGLDLLGGNVLRTSFADDLLLLQGFNGTGEGSADNSKSDPGNFAVVFNNLTLSSTRELYFPAPRPFYAAFQANGNFNPFSLDPGNTTTLRGVANLFFDDANVVPEPASLALLGIGLFGMAITRSRARRRNA